MVSGGVRLDEVGRATLRAELGGWKLLGRLALDLSRGEGMGAVDRYLSDNERLVQRALEDWRKAGVTYPLLAMLLVSFLVGVWLGRRARRG